MIRAPLPPTPVPLRVMASTTPVVPARSRVPPAATMVLGVRLVRVGNGVLMVKVSGLVVPPPCVGLMTVTLAVPALAKSAAGIMTLNCVALPKVGVARALQIAQAGVGKAVVLAHFALVAGFLVLTASEFIPLVYFGALLSLSMAGGLVSDLILLPLLLRWTTKDRPGIVQNTSSSTG